MSRQFYRGAEACILVYDLTNARSFHSLDGWKDNFLSGATPEDPTSFPFFLFGNKKDLIKKVKSKNSSKSDSSEGRSVATPLVNDWINTN